MDEPSKRERFEAAYAGQPPWDLGRPQEPFVEVADQITGSVLDAGCGTGANAIYFARRGQPVLGIDFVPAAIERAESRARDQGVEAEFLQLDALQMETLNRTFDSVIDCGLFHVFSDEDRAAYVAQLARVTRPGSRVFLMCFRDDEPGQTGPRRIRRDEIQSAFSEGWTIESIRPAQFATNPNAEPRGFTEGGPKAWFAIIRRAPR